MPFYRDSANRWTITYLDATGTALDVSGIDFRLELSQGCNCVSLTMGDGIEFNDDGTDGVVNYTLSKSRVNQFCNGEVRLRQFDDSESDPVLIHEGSATIEGRSFDA